LKKAYTLFRIVFSSISIILFIISVYVYLYFYMIFKFTIYKLKLNYILWKYSIPYNIRSELMNLYDEKIIDTLNSMNMFEIIKNVNVYK